MPGHAAEAKTYLLDWNRKRRIEDSLTRHSELASSVEQVHRMVSRAKRNDLWISYRADLTDRLLSSVRWPTPSLGNVLVLHELAMARLPALIACFDRVAFSPNGTFLSRQELSEALFAENRRDLVIGGTVDPKTRTVTLWRGDLTSLTVPFSAFPPSGDGTKPDFSLFSVTDFGQTVRLGRYEAASDAILYEFDPEYRRQVARERRATERSFGASLRRLRTLHRLRREDFSPLSSKTIARIERGETAPDGVGSRARKAISRALGVSWDEIASY